MCCRVTMWHLIKNNPACSDAYVLKGVERLVLNADLCSANYLNSILSSKDPGSTTKGKKLVKEFNAFRATLIKYWQGLILKPTIKATLLWSCPRIVNDHLHAVGNIKNTDSCFGFAYAYTNEEEGRNFKRIAFNLNKVLETGFSNDEGFIMETVNVFENFIPALVEASRQAMTNYTSKDGLNCSLQHSDVLGINLEYLLEDKLVPLQFDNFNDILHEKVMGPIAEMLVCIFASSFLYSCVSDVLYHISSNDFN